MLGGKPHITNNREIRNHWISQQQPWKTGPMKNVVTILTENDFQPWIIYFHKLLIITEDGIKTFSDIQGFQN